MDSELMSRWRMIAQWEYEEKHCRIREGGDGASLGADLVAIRKDLPILYVFGVDGLPLIVFIRGGRRGVGLGVLVGGN
jgi:hypothetical protein